MKIYIEEKDLIKMLSSNENYELKHVYFNKITIDIICCIKFKIDSVYFLTEFIQIRTKNGYFEILSQDGKQLDLCEIRYSVEQ